MLPAKPASSGIKIATIGKAFNVWSKQLTTLTAISSPINVTKSHGVRAFIDVNTLPSRISSSSMLPVEIPDDA